MDNRHSFLRLQPRTFAYAKVRNLLTFFSRGLVSQLFWRLSPSEQFAQMRMADAGARARLTASLGEFSERRSTLLEAFTTAIEVLGYASRLAQHFVLA